MKRYFYHLCLIAACFVLEARVSVFGVRPSAIVLVVYWFGLKEGPVKGIAYGAVLGAVADGVSGGILGPGMLGKGLVGYFASSLSRGVFRWTPLSGLLWAGALSALDGAITFTSLTVFDRQPSTVLFASVVVIVQTLVNSLAGMFIRPGDGD